jgi:RHS repeat-associated protein
MFKWIEAKRLAAAVAGLVAFGAASSPQVDLTFGASQATPQSARLADGDVVQLDRSKSQVKVIRSSGSASTLQAPGAGQATLLQLPDGGVWLEGLTDASGARTRGQLINSESGQLALAPDDGLPQYSNARYLALPDGRVLTVAGDGSVGSVWNPVTHLSSPVATGAIHPVDSLTLLRDGTALLNDGGPTSPVSQVIEPSSGIQRALSSSEAADLESSVPAWTAVAPIANSEAVVPGQRITVALSKAIDADSVTSDTVFLFGPGGAAPASVSLIDDGRLLVVSPTRELFPGSRYTVFLKGLRSTTGVGMPFGSYGFATASLGTTPGQGLTASTGAPGAAGVSGATEIAQSASGSASAKPVLHLSTGPQSNGVIRSNEDCKPGSSKLTLCRAHSEIRDGAFYPGRDAALNTYGGHWRTYLRHVDAVGKPQKLVRSKVRPKLLAASSTATGPGSIMGRVLTIDGNPVGNVTVSAGKATTRTGVDGVFTLKGLPIGQQVLFIDGASANRDGFDFGSFEVGAAVPDSGALKLPYNMYLPRVLPRDKVRIPSPTTQDLAITHPDIPGLEIDIPAGTVIHDRNGKVVTDLAVVPTPVDRAPFPTTNNYPVYFSIIPGGAVIQNLSGQASQGIRIKYPNYSHAKPGTVVKFWNYDDTNGWQVYGKGRVSADGTQFVPDDGVALTTTIHGSFTLQPYQGGSSGKSCAGTLRCSTDGDPVDLATGSLIRTWHDLGFNDITPLSLERTYRSGDTMPRAFGIGMSSGLDWYLFDENTDFSQPKLVLPSLATVAFNPILGDPADSGNDVLAEWKTTTGQGQFSGATLQHVAYTHNQFEEHWIIQTRAGEQYWFQNEQTNRLNQIVDRFGNTTMFDLSSGLLDSATSPSGRSIFFTYDEQNRISSAADSTGRTVSYVYNAAGYLGEVDYPDQTNEKYTYDESGELLTITDRRGHQAVAVTYTAGRVSKETFADGSAVTFDYTSGAGGYAAKTTTTEPNGTLRVTEFDPVSHAPSSETFGAGKPLAQTTTYSRDMDGNVTAMVDALGRKTSYQYDGTGHVTKITKLDGTADAVSTSFGYDGDSNLLASATDALNHTTTYGYTSGCLSYVKDARGSTYTRLCNAGGQPTSATDPIGHSVVLGYIGYDLRTSQDGIGRVSTYTVDGLGRLIAVKDADGNVTQRAFDVNDRVIQATDARGKSASYAYDGNGNVLSVTAPGGGQTSYVYDDTNQLIKRTDPEGRDESWTYDSLGHVLTYTDKKGQVTTSHYDVLGRRDKVTFNDGTTTSYSWDSGNRLNQVSDSVSGAITISHDLLDRVTMVSGPQGVVSYKYDALGRRIELDAGAAPPVQYVYDDANRLTSISQGAEAVGITYDNAGRRTSVTLPNGIVGTYSRAADDAITGITYARSDGTSIGGLSYGYGPSGQVTSQGGTLGQPGASLSMALGTVDASNRPSSLNGTSISFDADGNLTSDGVSTFVWNARNQLVQIRQGQTVTATYLYDALGRRYSRQLGTDVASSYLYDGQNIVQETRSGSTNVLLTGLGVDERFARSEASTRSYFLTGMLGSTVALADSGGNIIQSYSYDAYGAGSFGSATNPYQFAGRENDANGLYFMRARYYSVKMGRFISEDPLGLADGLNTYLYAAANPLGIIDPLGLFGMDDVWGAVYTLTDGWSPSQGAVDFWAGAGDAVSFDATAIIREFDGTGDSVDRCSAWYKAGSYSGAALGAARLGYAAAAKGIEMTAASGVEASAARAGLRRMFGGGPSLRPPNLAKYATDAELLSAAGRTNPYANTAGAGMLAQGVMNGLGYGTASGCE